MAKLKDIPKFDRPREKFLEKGADALTDSELLAILLGSGIKGTNVKVLAQKILKKYTDCFIWRAGIAKFFDNVNKNTLINIISRKIKDEIALKLIKEIIASYGCGQDNERE